MRVYGAPARCRARLSSLSGVGRDTSDGQAILFIATVTPAGVSAEASTSTYNFGFRPAGAEFWRNGG